LGGINQVFKAGNRFSVPSGFKSAVGIYPELFSGGVFSSILNSASLISAALGILGEWMS